MEEGYHSVTLSILLVHVYWLVVFGNIAKSTCMSGLG